MARHPLKFVLIGGVIALAAIGVGASLAVMKLKGNLDVVRRAEGANPGAADRTSLLRAENLAKAIAGIASKAGPGAQMIELQLEPKTARFALRRGSSTRPRGWIYTSDGKLRPSGVRELGGGDKTADKTFPLRQASAGTPEKIVEAIHRRDSRLSLKDVQLMTLGFDPIESRVVWSVSIGRGVTASLYLADIDGSHVRRPGVDPPTSGEGRASPYAGNPAAALARSERLMRCIARAHGDVAKLQACSPD